MPPSSASFPSNGRSLSGDRTSSYVCIQFIIYYTCIQLYMSIHSMHPSSSNVIEALYAYSRE